ncbi:hypothetical protein BX666DRAFT_2148269 [Dichotomocladium elegans]|nr:hypothetical protein BX666DRAFT_2148269 [Dichotomocladium elegans]
MNPSHCSVIVFSQTPPEPFVVKGESPIQHTSALDNEPAYTSLLRSVFGQVYVHSHHADALSQAKQQGNSIFLIDLDSITASPGDDYGYDSVTTISAPAGYSSSFSSSSCSIPSSLCSSIITTSDPRLFWIRKSTQFLHNSGIPIIVCSTRDDTALMLDCVHAGATDYLIKPLNLHGIKTLFLKLHRCHADTNTSTSSISSLQPLPALDTVLSKGPTLPCDNALQRRIQDITIKSTRFTQTVIDIYARSRVKVAHYRNFSCERATFLKQQISSWDFNPFELPANDLVHCAYLIFEQALTLPGLYELNITRDRLYDFIIDLSSTYYDGNPYHNFAHAVDVLQCTYFFLCRMGLLLFANDTNDENESESVSTPMFIHPLATATRQQQKRQEGPQDLLRPQDIFALLIAAIGHDAAHPGVNNSFLVNSASPLAMLYGDQSVLENFHTMTLFQVIHKHGLDQIGGGPGSTNYREFRKTVVTTILATDMSLHGDYISKFHSFTTDSSSDPQQNRLLLCSAIIKCSDISNVTRPFNRAARWAELLIEESVCQGDLERAMGLPSNPMNDRDSVVIEDSQIGFIRCIAIELFESVSQILPSMEFTVDRIHDNLREWELCKKAGSHDSGVASLEVSSSSSHTTAPTHGIGGLKRRGDGDAAAIDVLRKRLSIDQDHQVTRRRSSAGSVTEVLLAMPTYARMDHEDYVPQPHQPSQHPSYNAMLCQCCIQ